MLDSFVSAITYVSNPEVILFVFLGAIIGLIFGALPGLGGVIALAIFIPFTYGMEGMKAMFFLAGIMGSIAFGGSVSAILLNTPGTAPNAATCFDGFPMARQGRGREALAISATSSGFGALFGLIVLIAFIPFLRVIVMSIGPPELFMIVVFGLVTVAFAAKGNMIRGLIAGGIGVLISLIGFSHTFAVLRYTMGSEYLWDGIHLIPCLTGLFAVGELIHYSLKGGLVETGQKVQLKGSTIQGVKQVFQHKATFLRSCCIGTIVGIIPGIGGTVANFLAYSFAKKFSKHPETFGAGNPEGIIASEASNDAKDGGALLPTVGFGVPGSAEMAVLLGAFILHGVAPGPLLIRDHLDLVLVLILGLLLSNIIASSLGLVFSIYLSRVTFLNVAFIAPIVLILCCLGTYAARENLWDVALLLIAGFIGYGMKRFGFPVVCLVIGYVLGRMAETAFHQSLMISSGSYAIFIMRPISLGLLVVISIVVFSPFIRLFFSRLKDN